MLKKKKKKNVKRNLLKHAYVYFCATVCQQET